MKEEIINFLLGMSKEQLFEEVTKINLTQQEMEIFDKGKEYIDKMFEIKNEKSRKDIALHLITYGISKESEGK